MLTGEGEARATHQEAGARQRTVSTANKPDGGEKNFSVCVNMVWAVCLL
jgi:hypothetical protein